MKTIQLTNGQTAIVDDEDFAALSRFNWFAKRDKHTWYAARTSSRLDGPRKTLRMHREILGTRDPAALVDHKDGDGLNNVRSNLRIATPLQNARNVLRSTRMKRGACKGVQDVPSGFVARIRINKRLVYLGTFSTEQLASAAYNSAALRHFGEFAAVNSGAE